MMAMEFCIGCPAPHQCAEEGDCCAEGYTEAAKSSIDFQQRLGAAWDIIDEAIDDYDGWMLDDDYEPMIVLRRIIERMRERRNEVVTYQLKEDDRVFTSAWEFKHE